MSLKRFIDSGRPEWERLEGILKSKRSRQRSKTQVNLNELPSLLRRVCHDLALARHRCYSASLVAHLNELALRAHSQLYRGDDGAWTRMVRYVVSGFPRDLRSEWRLLASSLTMFFGVGIAITCWVLVYPEVAYSIMGTEALAKVEEMYKPGTTYPREADSDVQMFGFYVYNNIGIAFRVFAGGMLFGLGTVFSLLHNGLALGTIFGHVINFGGSTELFTFVIAHGAFELTGIAIAGVAGLRLGMALISPGKRPRSVAIQEAGRRSIGIISGAAFMLAIAACLEAFWSPRVSIEPFLKYAIGTGLWILVVLYFIFAGRHSVSKNHGQEV